jgi:methyltransferase (TIGR00027 family)
MAAKPAAGRSAHGAAMMKATELFVPRELRLFEDALLVDLLPWPARFGIRRSWIRDRFLAMLERGAPGIRGALLCRTRAIDEAVHAAIGRGLRAVVILGAGLDTRAYRLTVLKDAAVFEVDLPSIQDAKKKRLLRKFGSMPPHVRFVPMDFSADSLDVSLARSGLAPHEPAIFVWEGVTQYLTPSAVDAVLRTIAARPKRTELVFTYVVEDAVTGAFRADRSEAFRRSASHPPEPWLFGIDPPAMEAFLADRGLTLIEDVGAEEHLARYARPLGRELAVSGIERIARACVPTAD